MRLILVRHGETDSNNAGLALGRADVPLNATGHDQVRRLALALRPESIKAIYSSPLQRTMHTAEAIALPHQLAVTTDDRLVEMDVGEMDGMPLSEVRQKYPDFLARWLSSDAHLEPMPGGESLSQVRERAWEFVLELAARHGTESVCAVTHNFVILSLLTAALGLDLSGFRHLKHSLAAVSVLDFTGDRAQVLRINDTCHLQGG